MTPAHRSLSEEVAGLLLELNTGLRAHFAASAERLGLSPAQAKVLGILESPRPQREIARTLDVDASYVTAIVDQLGGLSLVERRPDPGDRRVKWIHLTARGRRAKARFEELLYSDLPGAAGMDDGELAVLRDHLRRMLDRMRTTSQVVDPVNI
ncbi:MarR family winged helix-turn-helix transcriptional regulator [Actinomadura napierensis]|uniref:MarR family transcriptional regulator n=1 Tax=Actinomadura napierensis TaxID=267854 RepID=A0ABN2ZY38_9ACTN